MCSQINLVAGQSGKKKYEKSEINLSLANLGPGLEHIPTQINPFGQFTQKELGEKNERNSLHGKSKRAEVGSTYLLRSISSPELHLSLTITPPPSSSTKGRGVYFQPNK